MRGEGYRVPHPGMVKRWQDPEYRARVNPCKRLRKLTDEQAHQVKLLLGTGMNPIDIQRVFDHVSIACIQQIKNGKTYKDIK